jgi:hypothetical protein
MPGNVHGDAIWVRREREPDALASARRNQLILYRSTGVQGKPVAVSGLVHIPKGKPPRGGWPIVTWAHGTTGLGDQCAPSRNPGEGAMHALTAYIEPLLDRFLDAGIAVVRTDHEGLGTKGVHPYLVGRSEGRSVLDIVRAARQAHDSLGRRVVVAGHSAATARPHAVAVPFRVVTPLLVEQGTAETTVFPAFTDAMVEGLRRRGAKVTYRRHENVDHTTVAFGEPQDEAFAWVSKRLR